jgi:hypothetical protein
MLSERVLMISKLLQEVLPEPLQAYHVYLIIVTNCGLAWLVWRLWIFTVVPRLYPHDPKVLPYWLPSKQFPSLKVLKPRLIFPQL